MVSRTILRGITASGLPAAATHQAFDGVAQACATQALRLSLVNWCYWHVVPSTNGPHACRFLTISTMLGSWASLVVGHILNNPNGLR
jgi:hypothetical protein